MKIEDNVKKWLLDARQPVIRYYTLRTLLDRSDSDPEVQVAHSAILKKGWAFDILETQKPQGNWESRKDLYRPKYTASNWRMIVLSDFALKYQDDKRLERACKLFFHDWLGDEEKFNESIDEVCIAGNLARMLTRFGYEDDPIVKRIFDWLVSDQKEDGGWHCFESNSGTVDCWEALAAYSALPKSKRTKSINSSIEKGAEFYLDRGLYREGKRYEPWFRFHYPNHYYYDLLVGLDMLTDLGFAGDKRLRPALQHLKRKKSPDGRWALDGVHPDVGEDADYTLKGKIHRFALEREGKPSKWITLKALTVLKRVEES